MKVETPLVKEVIMSMLMLLLALSLFMVLNTFFTLLIVDSTFLGVRQDFVSQPNLLELLLGGFWVFWILVRVVFNCKFFKGALNILLGGCPFKAHHVIVLVVGLILFLLAKALCYTGVNVDPHKRKDQK